MTASQAGYFSLQEFTDAGLLLVGGRIYTYTSGTTTQKVAYTDAAQTVPFTYTGDGQGGQYIALNARGELPAPLFLTTGAYDITLKRADGSTVWTRQAIGTADAAASVSAAILASLASPANGSGADLIGGVGRVVATIAALKQLSKTGAGKAFVLGYYASGDGGGGQYWYDSTDVSSTDNGGTIIVAADGSRWKLITSATGVSLKQFGARLDGVADDTAAMLACLSFFGGSDFGYNMPSAVIRLPAGGNMLFSSQIVMPVNVSLVCEGRCTFTSATPATVGITWRNPATAAGAQTYDKYFIYMEAAGVVRGIAFVCPVTVQCFIELKFYNCVFGSSTGTFVGITLKNAVTTVGSIPIWTERTYFDPACFFAGGGGAFTIVFDATAGTNSFGYTVFDHCLVSGSNTANGGGLISVQNNAALYGSKIALRGNWSSNAAITTDLFKTIGGGAITQCGFDVRIEDTVGLGTPRLFNLTNGNFWDNYGAIDLPSFNWTCVDTGVSYRDNSALLIKGASFTDMWGGGITIANSATYWTKCTPSVSKREIVQMKYAEYFHSGQMTCTVQGAGVIVANQIAGVLPNGLSTILRTEISARLASSGNPSGKFFFDIRKGIDTASFAYLGSTSIFLTDGSMVSNQSQAVTSTLLAGAPNNVLMANPTDTPPTVNNGTAPTDVWFRVYYV